jgi:hypothetical protein
MNDVRDAAGMRAMVYTAAVIAAAGLAVLLARLLGWLTARFFVR